MKPIWKLGAIAAICAVASLGAAMAAPQMQMPAPPPGKVGLTPLGEMSEAIGRGDTVKIAQLLAKAKRDGVDMELARLAHMLLASAQATQKAGNSTGAALLAAFAVSSGGLTGTDNTAALAIVNLSPTAEALISNPNAPATGSNSLSATLANSGTIIVATTVISPSQATSGSPS